MPDDPNARELRALVRELLDRQREADRMLATDAHGAVKAAAAAALHAVMRLDACVAGDERSRVVPGAALARLLAAFEDRDGGISSPLLQPLEPRGGNNLDMTVTLRRVEPVVAMELLKRAGRTRDEAAAEVARLMGHDHPMFADLDGER
jgi:hypothetical protein